MNIRTVQEGDEQPLIRLIAGFRASLAELRGNPTELDFAAAVEELNEYREKHLPIFVAEDANISLAGYLVCRVDGDVAWVESLYVKPEYRRMGVGSMLYNEAERLSQHLGGGTPYNWVDPNNDRMIYFLQNRGYNVLNLIELRKPYPGETVSAKVSVGKHQFGRRG